MRTQNKKVCFVFWFHCQGCTAGADYQGLAVSTVLSRATGKGRVTYSVSCSETGEVSETLPISLS